MSDAPRIVLHPKPGITAEQTRDARARAWAYVFERWHAKKGGPHGLTNEMVTRAEGVNDKKGQDSNVRR
jgi:hypothetical protein